VVVFFFSPPGVLLELFFWYAPPVNAANNPLLFCFFVTALNGFGDGCFWPWPFFPFHLLQRGGDFFFSLPCREDPAQYLPLSPPPYFFPSLFPQSTGTAKPVSLAGIMADGSFFLFEMIRLRIGSPSTGSLVWIRPLLQSFLEEGTALFFFFFLGT